MILELWQSKYECIQNYFTGPGIGLSYTGSSLFIATVIDLFLIIIYLFIFIMFIWFGEELGSLTGIHFGDTLNPIVTQPSPGLAVRIIGSVLLILPSIIVLLTHC